MCCDVAGGICDPLATYRRLGSVQLAFCIGLCAQATFNRRNPAITAKKIAELEVVVKDQVGAAGVLGAFFFVFVVVVVPCVVPFRPSLPCCEWRRLQ